MTFNDYLVTFQSVLVLILGWKLINAQMALDMAEMKLEHYQYCSHTNHVLHPKEFVTQIEEKD